MMRSLSFPLLLLICSANSGCSDKNATQGEDSEGSSSTASGGNSASGSATGGGAGKGSSGSDGGPANRACGLAEGSSSLSFSSRASQVTSFEACVAESQEAESLKADVFIMLDQSISMGQNHVVPSDPTSPTRWQALTDALKGFISSPDSRGLRVGIQYFGLGTPGQVSCDEEDYAQADVEIGSLPDNAAALLDSIDRHGPSNFTPSVPALKGALSHAHTWALSNQGQPTIVVFATDGYPTECDDRAISDLVEVAQSYANPDDDGPSISTFVLGVGELPNLEVVAKAGGTQHAFFVADCPSAAEDLQAALSRMARSPALCRFEMPSAPPGELLDTQLVNLVFSPADGSAPQVIPRIADRSQCSSGGWYYDDENDPTEVNVCPSTCNFFGGGVVDLILGCQTVSIQ